jgi:PAS domain S-box-containing protein
MGLNLAGALMLGKDRSHVINQHFHFFVSNDTKAIFNFFLERVFNSNVKESCEVNLTTSGKQSLFVHLSGIATGNGSQCLVTAVDITERRHTEKKLQDIIDKNPLSIQILDIDGFTIQTNLAHFNLFGAVVPQGYSLFQDPQLVQQGFGALFERIKMGEVVSFPDSYFNAHDVDSSFPDIPITIKVTGFSLTDDNGIEEEIVLMQENITERKQAQQKLEASEKRYHSIFQGSPDGILIADVETKMIAYANSAQCRLFGYTEEQFKTMSIADIHPLDTFAHTLAEFESMLRGEKALAENIQCLKKNGEIFYADISGAIILFNGKTNLLGFFRDITERKNAETALKASEEKYHKDLIFLQSIIESPITIVIFSIDKDYCYKRFTESHKETMRKIWGVDIQIGMNLLDLISNPEDRKKAKDNFDRAFGGDFFILTEEYGDKELSRIYYDNYYSPVNDAGGNIVGISVFVLDVTQRKQAELEVIKLNTNLELTVNRRTSQYQEALGRLEKIADRVPGVVYQFQMNPDGSSCFPFASDGIQDIYRVNPEEVVHDASIVFSRIHPDDFGGVVASIQASAKNLTLWQYEYRVKFDDGNVRWLSGNAQPQSEADGTVLWHGHISDITDRKQAEAAIIKAKDEAVMANQAKSEFLSRMSHELRTPMNSMLGFAQLLDMAELKGSHKKGVTHILNSGKHLLNLINEVLDISGIEAGRVSLSLVPVQLSSIIMETIDTVHIAAQAIHVKIEWVNTDHDLLFVKADPHRLRQVLLNLINNAIKYNNEGGSVTIKTEIRQAIALEMSLVRISVSDTGGGINPENIEKLFMPFERIGAEKTGIEGTGLGLMVVKKLMNAMGGSVGVESVPGEGSTFWIELPHSEDQETEAWQTEQKSLSHAMINEKTGTILYVEDNASNTELVEQILLDHRPSIHFVNTTKGAQAVSLAIENSPDLILLDLDLPDLQGYEVIKFLQAEEKTRNIPVVVISADAMPRQIEKLMNAGSKDYLNKPLDIRTFLAVVDEWVGSAKQLPVSDKF